MADITGYWHKFFTVVYMSLTLYKKKRRFNETPEPSGKEKSSKGFLRFVIQKHDASHVHYDFRLEMEGVLKSWAVPKGPSLNPSDKRLAMMVEDHPYDYRNFEGVIPAGNYGGGTVIVWDEGTYEPIDAEGLSRKEQEKLLLKQLYSGNLKIRMHGQKIKGDYALFQMKGRGERSWILTKKSDEFASEKDITENEKSVKSGKTLVQVAEENGTTVNHPEAHGKKATSLKLQAASKPVQLLNAEERKTSKKKTAAKKSTKSSSSKSSKSAGSSAAASAKAGKKKAQSVKELLGDSFLLSTRSPMPKEVVPMLATLVNEPFDNENWIFEIKWDGYRAVTYCDGKNVELISRNLTPFTEKYYPVTDAFKRLKLKAVFDGEIVAVDERGLAVFQSLQNWQNTPVQLQYFIFDILWLDGYDLTQIPLAERKRILKEVLPEDEEVIKYSDHVVGEGKDFFEVAVSKGLEGIMAKKANSIYQIDKRTENWVKIKVNLRQEVIIAGFTQPRNTRKFFGSLLLGLYDGDELVYVGHTGSGFNAKSLEQIYKKLQPWVTADCPFEKCPKGNMPVTWVKPKLVCEIKFAEWTKDRIARQPIFMGLRVDKKAKDVTFEKTVNINMIKKATSGKVKGKRGKAEGEKDRGQSVNKNATPKKAEQPLSKSFKPAIKKSKTSSAKTSGKQVDLNDGEDQKIVLDRHELKLTNLNKVYWKKEKFSKGDMINYYLKAAPYILPYMLHRPQSLNRHPSGIDGPNFFQKNQRGKLPEWMQTHEDFSESTNETIEYLVCSNEATLIYMANLGCIEMHPWHSRSQSWQNPDWCLIDLDPDKPNTFEQVMEVAKLVKKVLDSIGADACVKTSGSTGIHIYIPLGAKYDYDQSKQLAELVVTLVNHELPDLTSVERSPSKRKGKIYLDYLQNRETQTAAAPYSLRPKPGVPVSTPLDWSELKKGLIPTTYNAQNIFDRLKIEGDLFKPVLGKGIDLEKVLSKLAGQMK
jgi:bifunctional non-homologous end joining protein LigD